ncbi:type VI secretion system baseplate subunit TssE [Aquincola sp. S2]|uniref:Type VI secretion system baseplate subunit TssE n=1 Tax=Pseudaquabacterium terrae TaxID=2732868 RepID=A0ABX2ED50_9BURK|nr:type VI secretion system baseplate subunit TssE [Aquabacterium terrae]NRF66462.1 type VI secretion system baseplate subunit TssE [Aquabacterium terrae]
MATGEVRDRLQPALLDRLTDESPHDRHEPSERRVMSKTQMRQAVLRDLSWLFNATQPLPQAQQEQHPQIAESVLNYGLPALSGQLVSRVDVGQLERSIRQAILRFEPRLLPESLKVIALEATHVLDTHNTIEFEIRGHLWAQPVPLEVLLRTKLDLEAGQVEVRDASSSAPSRAR